ncbi:PAS domain-containing protein [Streptomyces sp. KL116D]|uniref:PAS domain-containing protein n=1 Tax=Streptomyces sp. KL116D TaxID=3045152 RepID=UPI003557397F
MNFTRWSARLRNAAPRGAAPTTCGLSEATARCPRPAPSTLPDEPQEGATAEGGVDELPARAVLDRIPALVAPGARPRAPHRRRQRRVHRRPFGDRPCGEPARDALPELDELSLLPLLDQVLRSAKPRTVKSRKTSGGHRSYTVTCTPLETAEGPGVLIFAADVTDHAEAAERLRTSGANSARRQSPCSAACCRRSWRSPTTCGSPPRTSRAAPRPRSAATGTT